MRLSTSLFNICQRSVRNHRDKEYSNSSLLVYGNGDGGGGPLASMIERLRRMKDVVRRGGEESCSQRSN
jgi:alpha-mannosidase